MFVRRHDPRPRLDGGSVHGPCGRRRRARRVFPARCARDRTTQPGSDGGVLRRGVRDDRTGERDGGQAGAPARDRELRPAGGARLGAAGDHGDPGLAGEQGPRVPRPRSRVRDPGMARVRADRPGFRRPARRDRVRADRPARGDPDAGPAARGGSHRRREPVRACGGPRREPGGAARRGRGLRDRRSCLARDRGDREERPQAPARRTPITTPRCSSPTTAALRRASRRCVSRDRSFEAWRSRITVRPSGRSARRSTRSGHRWSPPKARAPRTSSPDASGRRPPRESAA